MELKAQTKNIREKERESEKKMECAALDTFLIIIIFFLGLSDLIDMWW